jgi:hypothetical protein
MQITLSKDQYEKLAHLVYLGNWMINSYRTDDRVEAYDLVAEHILSFAPAAGLKDYVDFDEFEGKYFPSSKLDEEVQGFLEEYDDDVFWNLLVDRLAERDLVRQYGEEFIENLEWDEYNQKADPFWRKYEDEVGEFGVERLEVVRVS